MDSDGERSVGLHRLLRMQGSISGSLEHASLAQISSEGLIGRNARDPDGSLAGRPHTIHQITRYLAAPRMENI
uniref:Uncharacterized protein n=1 Tax=Anguilla anguilla TaxID=7936 RepID=A0A0E9QYQ1_ANGAN